MATITVENVKIEKTGSFFTNAAGNLPMSMSSPSMFGNNVANDPNFPLGPNEYYNMMQKDRAIMQTLPYINYTNTNMSISAIDSHMPSNNGKYFGFNYTGLDDDESNGFENPFKIDSEVMTEFNKYKMIYKNAFVSFIDIGSEEQGEEGKGGKTFVAGVQSSITESLFNPFIAVNTIGMMENVPLVNADIMADLESNAFPLNSAGDGISDTPKSDNGVLVKSANLGNNLESTSDCSIKTLVRLSEETKPVGNDSSRMISKLGMARYKWADFMYCKDLGKYSNNMLITLRKFPHPIGDNIFSVFGYGDGTENDLGTCPDVGRMIAWLGDENKLEDICKFNYNESWKPLNAEPEQMPSQSDDTMLGQLFNLGNPKYIQGFKEGRWGGNNTILGNWTSEANSFFFGSKREILSNKGTYENVPSMTGQNYDTNKVYSKQGTVQDTHIYEGKLTFTHSFTLTFNYQLRAYENINPKSAFLDLIGNILNTTYRKGEFWGGSRSIYGAPGNNKNKGWDIANKVINQVAGGAGDTTKFLAELLGGQSPSFDMYFDKIKSRMDAAANALTGGGGMPKTIDEAKSRLQSLLSGNTIKIGNLMEGLVSGSLKNGLGRPAVYAFKSLLSGEPVGLWHVTIGNPRNPIMAMGNLIIEGTDFQLYGPLGIDDFPSGIKVSVTLKHAKSRDASEIANMFTRGETSIGFKLIGGNSLGAPEKYLDAASNHIKKFGTKDREKIIAAMASAQ